MYARHPTRQALGQLVIFAQLTWPLKGSRSSWRNNFLLFSLKASLKHVTSGTPDSELILLRKTEKQLEKSESGNVASFLFSLCHPPKNRHCFPDHTMKIFNLERLKIIRKVGRPACRSGRFSGPETGQSLPQRPALVQLARAGAVVPYMDFPRLLPDCHFRIPKEILNEWQGRSGMKRNLKRGHKRGHAKESGSSVRLWPFLTTFKRKKP